MTHNAPRPAGKITGTFSPYIIWICLLCLLAIFIVCPLLRVFSEAKISEWRRVFASGRWIVSAGHTLLLTLLSTFFSVLAGSVYAYAVSRGGLPGARFFSFIPLLHLITPPFVGGLSFMLLFGRQGFFTKTLFHQDISLYGLPGLLIAQTLSFFPLAFLIQRSAFDGINPSLEYAARDSGAGRWRVFASVTLPLSIGGIVSSSLFIAISVLSDFGNPILIGGRFNVLAVDLYTQLTGWSNAGTSAVMGIILLIPAMVLFIFQRAAFYKKSGRAATVGSRASGFGTRGETDTPRLLLPPLWVRALLFVFCAFIAFIVAAQFLAVAGGTFSRVWGIDPTFTAEHFFASLGYKTELTNTFFCAFLGAAASTIVAALTAFFAHRTTLPLRRAADFVVTLPAAIPGSLIGLAFVLAFNGPVVRLTGTRLIIVIAMAVCALPASYRILCSSVMSIKTTLDDSARSLGASTLRLFWTVIRPLISRGIVSSFVFSFVRASGTLSAVIFLVSFKTKLASVLILNLAAQGDWGTSAALAFILTVIIFVSLGILRLLGGKPQDL
jgi:iron(III) transport system permease protein